MVERKLKGLEHFRNIHFPFLYVIENKGMATSVIQSFTKKPYGLEVGFGEEPTRVFNIDDGIPWLLTEPDERYFSYFKRNIKYFWENVDSQTLKMTHPIIALNTYSTTTMERNAEVIVHRNLDYRNMFMVPFEDLRAKQRVVFIVDMLHIDEMDRYHSFLREYGYAPQQLQVRSKDLPLLTTSVPFAPDDYVLDITK
ncbi:MAG: hypothetical protein NT149_04410 [Candidatus Gottesmanbacteria bacterium]|nr:hypothetical protein [Candidatus Gottesmanbacteria bacterium]